MTSLERIHRDQNSMVDLRQIHRDSMALDRAHLDSTIKEWIGRQGEVTREEVQNLATRNERGDRSYPDSEEDSPAENP